MVMKNHRRELAAWRSWLREQRRQGLLEEAQSEAIDAGLAGVEHGMKVKDLKKVEKAINALSKAILRWKR